MVLTCSDWHVEETVDPAEVNGLNDFNLAIAGERVSRLISGFHWLYDLHVGKHYKIRDVVVALIGDMISGWIHDELMVTNGLGPPPAVVFFEDLARKLLKSILETHKDVTVHLVCVAGNHGRLTHKKMVKGKTHTSIEWVAYANLARWLRENYPRRVKIHVAPGAMCYLDTYGYVNRFIHGDQIGYGGGIGGVTIPLNKKLLRWDKKIKAHCTYLGHFHQYTPSSNFQMNGSLIGYSEFANWIAGEWEPPIQSLNVIDSRYGRTGLWPIFCSEDHKIGSDPRTPSLGEQEIKRQLEGRSL